jgi:hypothetical protein
LDSSPPASASSPFSRLRGAVRPARNADGIVVLTGGSSRVSDAMELSRRYGKRLLISGVHRPTTFTTSRACCRQSQPQLLLDLDHSAVSTAAMPPRPGAGRERGFTSLVVVTSNYHAAGDRGAVACHARRHVDSSPLSATWREAVWTSATPAVTVGIRRYVAAEVRVRLAAIA